MTVIEGNVRPTLLRPPEHDEDKSLIENVLDVTELKVLGTVSYAFYFRFTYFIIATTRTASAYAQPIHDRYNTDQGY